MKKILIVFGTRPEAIKLAPVINKLKEREKDFKAIICVTAQHREMLDQVLSIFNIKPDYDLDIMKNNQNLFDITTKVLVGLKSVLEEANPDLVMVQGDTTTAFIAGLGAFYLKIPVAHVEAGLRTYNKYNPFPEDMNRHLLSAIADYHFAPTEWSKTNLMKEHIPKERIWVTGNTVIDALLEIVKRQKADKPNNIISKFKVQSSKLILVTGHRRESFGEGFENICQALREIAQKRSDIIIVYPVHLNPNVRQPVNKILKNIANVVLIEPIDYEPFVSLMNRSYLILTDSGGIQEEAPSLGKPVLVMRNTTERPEGVEAGVVKLVGTVKDSIVENVFELLDNKDIYEGMSKKANPYGDGKAAERIADILSSILV
ncbi:MAG TPA: UDP-N-acetylglucosamine 2-epimerase (non-hydrolyzing) [Syntrophorhabdaceae bacterium]|nr:UDP-N-acetylglucosamine 2-epimerase (non-hydrolyzing) [Syntrophorhabdaceae bacterium]